jgi:hypothetical protein
MEAYSLSKEGLQMGFGKWLIYKVKDESHYEYYHMLLLMILPTGKPLSDTFWILLMFIVQHCPIDNHFQT